MLVYQVFSYFDCTMAEAVSCRPVTAVARVRFQLSLCEICGGQSGTASGFFSEYFGIPQSVSFYQYSILILIYTLLLADEETGEDWELSEQQSCFGNGGLTLGQKVISDLHYFAAVTHHVKRPD
jgi:hypothetical protein